MENGISGVIPVDVVRNAPAINGSVQKDSKDYATIHAP